MSTRAPGRLPAHFSGRGAKIVVISLVTIIGCTLVVVPRAAFGGSDDGIAPSIPIFRAHCVRCHDPDGSGESSRDLIRTIPDFTDPNWQVVRSDHELLRSVLNGKGKMPSMKEHLAGADVNMIIRLVRRFQGGSVDVSEDNAAGGVEVPTGERRGDRPARPSARLAGVTEGKPDSAATQPAFGIYQRFCASCHGADGRSSPLRPTVASAPDFTLPSWHAERGPARLKISILEGRGTRMPSFHGKIGAPQVESLVSLLRSFSASAATEPNKSLDDFDRRFEQLMKELETLKRHYYEPTPRVSSAARAPAE
jgi:mono/diheme cytochrome c family protein